MPRTATQPGALTIGQLAKRWGVSGDRVRQLLECGLLPEAFRIPSAGCYGDTVKIPLSAVLQAETEWRIIPATGTVKRKRDRRNGRLEAGLRHFPELSPNPEPDVECPSSDLH